MKKEKREDVEKKRDVRLGKRWRCCCDKEKNDVDLERWRLMIEKKKIDIKKKRKRWKDRLDRRIYRERCWCKG